jgi:hypothetical protein
LLRERAPTRRWRKGPALAHASLGSWAQRFDSCALMQSQFLDEKTTGVRRASRTSKRPSSCKQGMSDPDGKVATP